MNSARLRNRLRAARRDDGFTLPELLITTVIMGVIIASIGAAMAVALRTQEQPARKLGPSNDANLLASYFTADVQSASSSDFSAAAPSGCNYVTPVGSTNVVALSWIDNAPATPLGRAVAYHVNTTQRTLTRVSCVPNQVPSLSVVARNVTAATAEVDTAVSSIKMNITALAADAAVGEPPFTFSLRAYGRLAGSDSGGGSGGGSGADQLPAGEIGGTVTQYSDEAGTATPVVLAGKLLTLSQGGVVRATSVTGTNGKYYFGTLDNGAYDLLLTAVGHAPTTGNSHTVAVTVAGGTVTQNIGVWIPLGSVSGLARLDNAAASPLAGVTVALAGPINAAATTGVNGLYAFAALPFGTYTVTFTGPAGHTLVSGSPCGFVVADAAPDACADVVFHNGISDITGTVLVDNDGNGTGDVAHFGVTITLTRPGGLPPLTATTNAAGTFSFPGLPNGNYTVTETLPATYSAVGPITAARTVNGTVAPATVAFVTRQQCALAAPVPASDDRAIKLSGALPQNNEVITVSMDRPCGATVNFRFPVRVAPYLAGPTSVPFSVAAAAVPASNTYTSPNLRTGSPAWSTTGSAPRTAAVEVWEGPVDTGRLVGILAVSAT